MNLLELKLLTITVTFLPDRSIYCIWLLVPTFHTLFYKIANIGTRTVLK